MVLDFSITDLVGHQGQRKHSPWWFRGGIAVPDAKGTLPELKQTRPFICILV